MPYIYVFFWYNESRTFPNVVVVSIKLTQSIVQKRTRSNLNLDREREKFFKFQCISNAFKCRPAGRKPNSKAILTDIRLG